MKRSRTGLVFKAFVSLNSRFESNKDEETGDKKPPCSLWSGSSRGVLGSRFISGFWVEVKGRCVRWLGLGP